MLIGILLIVFVVFFILNKLNETNIRIVDHKENKNTTNNNTLIKVLNNISSGDKIILENIDKKIYMNKDTIDEEFKNEVIDIIKDLLRSIENFTTYNFFINSIENIYVMKDENGNYRCILTSFINEINRFYTTKIVVDYVSYDDEIFFNFIDIDESSINNILDKYDVKWRGSGILSNHDMFDKNIFVILDDYYNDNFEIVYLNNEIMEVDKTSLFSLNQLKQNFLPSNFPKDKLPYQGPGSIVNNPDKNKYMWLFSPDHGSLKSSGQY